jgi:hypothetical protein
MRARMMYDAQHLSFHQRGEPPEGQGADAALSASWPTSATLRVRRVAQGSSLPL